jgi:nucleoside-diphosphate-sugar epimerase
MTADRAAAGDRPARILVTGGAGYVGSVLLRAILDAGYDVTCVDRLDFGGESLLGLWNHPRFHFARVDLNDHAAVERMLHGGGFWAVLHLAAIVGDPACARDPEEATRTNWHAGRHLADASAAAGVERFVFASTCSNYGRMTDPGAFVDESSELRPISLYAELKVRLERYLLDELPRQGTFAPTVLRFSTVYGASPRMRFDLTVNEFTKELAMGRRLVVFGQQFWRPYCHVRDFARAYLAVLGADRETVAFEVFNVGTTSENYTKQMLVEELLRLFPGGEVEYVERKEDPRDYRVNADRIRDRLGFANAMRVPDGMREVAEILDAGIIRDPDDQRYYNIPHAR